MNTDQISKLLLALEDDLNALKERNRKLESELAKLKDNLLFGFFALVAMSLVFKVGSFVLMK